MPRAEEAARSAVEVYKRLLYIILEHPTPLVDEVRAIWTAFERELQQRSADAEALANFAFHAGDRGLARRHLTRFSYDQLLRGLDLTEKLVAAMDAGRQMQFGVRAFASPEGPEQIW